MRDNIKKLRADFNGLNNDINLLSKNIVDLKRLVLLVQKNLDIIDEKLEYNQIELPPDWGKKRFTPSTGSYWYYPPSVQEEQGSNSFNP